MLEGLMLDSFFGITLTLVLVGVFWTCLVLLVGQRKKQESERKEYSIALLERSIELQERLVELLAETQVVARGPAGGSGGLGDRQMANASG